MYAWTRVSIICVDRDNSFPLGYGGYGYPSEGTLKSSPPENKVMKKAALIEISTSTMFYMLRGLVGYTLFGNKASGIFLTGFGFFEPYWLIDLANICIVHPVGAYQVDFTLGQT